MSVYKILFFIFLIISAFFAFFGFYQSGLLYLEIAIVGCAIIWIFLREKNPSVCLIISIIITAVGILLGVNFFFMVLYCGFSLALWDITLMELRISENAYNTKIKLYNLVRLSSLGLALVISFVIIFTCRFINIKIPFFIIVILAISAFLCIKRIVIIFSKKLK